MFLPTSTLDYTPRSPPLSLPEGDSDTESEASGSSSSPDGRSKPSQASQPKRTGDDVRSIAKRHAASPEIDDLPALSKLSLNSSESYLWSYFHNAIAPSCVLDPTRNPYQDIILRIAASTGNSSPLFHSIMAISTSQLYLLGKKDFYESSWTYRQKALRSLRLQTNKMEGNGTDQNLEAQILATVMAMVFLDVSNHLSCILPTLLTFTSRS